MRQAIPTTVHESLVRGIADRLTHDGWTVDVEPNLGGYRPDLVMQTPDGATLVVAEVKAKEDQVHFASLGQVAAYRRSISERLGSAPAAFVISTGTASAELERLADELSVELVTVPNRESDEAISAVVERLEQVGRAQDPQ